MASVEFLMSARAWALSRLAGFLFINQFSEYLLRSTQGQKLGKNLTAYEVTKPDIDSLGSSKPLCVECRMEPVDVKTTILGILGAISLTSITLSITPGTMGYGVLAEGNTPVGLWKTIDDDSNEPSSYVRISLDNGELNGRVEKLIRKPGEQSDPKCTQCAGDKKNQPILGMTIIYGLRQEGEVWAGGHILDPGNGTIYKCRIKVEDGGRKLEVRGYIGFSLIGRSQTWHREP